MRNNIRVAKAISVAEIKRRVLAGCPGKTQVSGEVIGWVEKLMDATIEVIVIHNKYTEGKRVI